MSVSDADRRVTVLGAGAFGTALAATAVRSGNRVHLWGRDTSAIDRIRTDRINPRLPGLKLPEDLIAASEWATESTPPEVILLVTPAQSTRLLMEKISATPQYQTVPLVLCAKGIDRDTGHLLSEVAEAAAPDARPGVLSGPSFASDLARGLPTAVSVAADTLAQAEDFAAVFAGGNLRCYASDDVRGVELGGALKNVMAIAAGIVAGRKLGASAQAALVTRGLVEMRRLAVAMGARAETLNGLSGLGDLILTCASTQSRNFSYGVAVGEGRALEDLPLAEGVFTADIAAKLADDHGVDAPIISTVSAVLDKRLNVDDAIKALLARPLKVEA